KVWTDTFVEEVNLAKNVSCLRKILATEHLEHYIETIPKRGYRFVAGVREVWAEEPAPQVPELDLLSPHITADPAREDVEIRIEALASGNGVLKSSGFLGAEPSVAASTRSRSLGSRVALPAVFLTLGAVVALGIWYFVLRPTPKPVTPLLKITPVTSLAGTEDQAAFSPDGKLLTTPDKRSHPQPFSIFSISIEGGEKIKLTAPPTGFLGDFFPAFSPDQKTLAFVRSVSIAAADIYLLPLAGGESRRLTFDNTSIRGLSWTSDGKEIVFASRRGGSTYNLWKISITDATCERLTTNERDVYSPTISRQGNRLSYTQSMMDGNIWRFALHSAKSQENSPLK